MTNHNAEPRFDGTDRNTAHGRMLPYQSGVLSADFKDRLESLKEASGLTWSAFSQTIGVDRKQVRRWRRKGVEPSGGPWSPSTASRAGSPAAWTSSWATASR